mgnify:CR=1 FL=1|jgi:hypothetical protein
MERKTREKTETIEDMHPMTQITIASIVQVCVLGLMFLSMITINIAI